MAIDDQPYVPASGGFYMTDAITERAIRMVHDAATKPNPYLLYLAYTAPHWPLQAYPSDIEKYRGHYREGWDVLRQRRHKRQIAMGIIKSEWKLSPRYEKVPAWDTLTEKEKDEWDLRMAVYAAQIDRMDQDIGKLLQALEQRHQLDNTIVFFLSDNGASAEEKIGKGARQTRKTPYPADQNRLPATALHGPISLILLSRCSSTTPTRVENAAPLIAWSPKYISRRNALEHTQPCDGYSSNNVEARWRTLPGRIQGQHNYSFGRRGFLAFGARPQAAHLETSSGNIPEIAHSATAIGRLSLVSKGHGRSITWLRIELNLRMSLLRSPSIFTSNGSTVAAMGRSNWRASMGKPPVKKGHQC